MSQPPFRSLERSRTRTRTRTRGARPRLVRFLAAALLLSAAASGGARAAGPDPRAATAPGDAPETAFWVDPNSNAARQAIAWRSQGRTADARLIERIAGRPQAVWLHSPGPGSTVRAAAEAAAAARRTPVLVAYFIPHRDCGDYSGGGAATAAEYRRWIDEFAAGIGERAAYVIVEPDAVAQKIAGCAKADARERYGLLAYAVERLKARPHAKVYLDAGNSGWIPDESRLVAPLRQAGIAGADGFAVNVSNYQTNAASSEYGHRIAAALGGAKHFVVDSSRNGNGPYTGGGDEAWCNPPGRALGVPPTTATGDPALDAYLWIKRPGESDGTCRGGPRAGQWWPQYALGLASRARG
ncbi:glycoside hydrolase family 6 protein [Streptomyces sp. NPDC088360]|uniref:glycoside hydrolase family 6 protein n=1 Tax=Streptomyces sp. NPDC088360 TaxID=3154515 RepID=UPI00344F3FDF